MNNNKVPKRISQTVLNSLKGGVVPRIGLPYITVGRKNEIEALLHDVDIISEGGASFRFIVGRRRALRQRKKLPDADHTQLRDGQGLHRG